MNPKLVTVTVVPAGRRSTSRNVSFQDGLDSTGIDSSEMSEIIPDERSNHLSADVADISPLLALFSNVVTDLRKEKGWIFDYAVEELVRQSGFTKTMLKKNNIRTELLRIFVLEWMDQNQACVDFRWAYPSTEAFLRQYPSFSNQIWPTGNIENLLRFANWMFLLLRALKTGRTLKRQILGVLDSCLDGEERLPSSAQQNAARSLILTTETGLLKQSEYSPTSLRLFSSAKEKAPEEPDLKKTRTISPPSTPLNQVQKGAGNEPPKLLSSSVYGSADSGSEPFERSFYNPFSDNLEARDFDHLPEAEPEPEPEPEPLLDECFDVGPIVCAVDIQRDDGLKLTKVKKRKLLYVETQDASTQSDESGFVGQAFASAAGLQFRHPELRHELSILSWLSENVTNDQFQIGVLTIPGEDSDNAFNAANAFNKRVYHPEDTTSSTGRKSSFDLGVVFPWQAAADGRSRDFLTTTVLLDPGTSTLPPPKLARKSSPSLCSMSPLGLDLSLPSKCERQYSWGQLAGPAQVTPVYKSAQNVLAEYAPM